jgi:2'-hydroxyisoflavone reductase
MKILVLGGTQFVGRHIVEAMVEAGHSVSVFNRGKTAGQLPARVERLRGDRDLGVAGLDALKGRTWDVCVDVSGFTARHVRSSAELLRKNAGHYVFISAVSVYGDPPQGPVYETHPRLAAAAEGVTEVNGDTYGPLKVTCEDIVQELYGSRCAVLRPQVVAGPHDPYDRFSYWVRRATQRGKMLAPGDGSDYLQVIDARDVAQFTLTVSEKALEGCFNLAGPRLTWAEFIKILSAQNVAWVPTKIIRAAGLTEFELPLYRPVGGPRSSLMHVSNERAVAAGLTLTDPKATVNAVRAWPGLHDLAPALSPGREAELIAMSATRLLFPINIGHLH